VLVCAWGLSKNECTEASLQGDYVKGYGSASPEKTRAGRVHMNNDIGIMLGGRGYK